MPKQAIYFPIILNILLFAIFELIWCSICLNQDKITSFVFHKQIAVF